MDQEWVLGRSLPLHIIPSSICNISKSSCLIYLRYRSPTHPGHKRLQNRHEILQPCPETGFFTILSVLLILIGFPHFSTTSHRVFSPFNWKEKCLATHILHRFFTPMQWSVTSNPTPRPEAWLMLRLQLNENIWLSVILQWNLPPKFSAQCGTSFGHFSFSVCLCQLVWKSGQKYLTNH